MNLSKVVVFALVAIVCDSLVPGSPAAIVANFTDGNDNTNGGANPPSVDSYRGTAGNGWATAWRANTNLGPIFSASVENTSPVNGGGNYLNVSLNQTTGSFGQAAVTRQYGNQGGVQLDQPHVISFDFRTDAGLTTGNINDRYQIFDHINANESATLSPNTWVIASYGSGAGGPSGIVPGNWGFLSGSTSTNAFSSQQFIDTGFAITAGVTYHMVVATDPTTKSWSASISDGATTFTSGTLLWRNQTISTVGGNLYWGLQQTSAVGQNVGAYQFSLDNISIVPEPATGGVLALMSSLLLVGRRKQTLTVS